MNSVEIYSLPSEIIFEVIFYLEVREFSLLSSSCRHFFQFWTEEKIWKKLLQRDFPEISLSSENSSSVYRNFNKLSKIIRYTPIFFINIQDQLDEIVTKTLSDSPESVTGICLACWSNYNEDIFDFFQQKGNERLASIFFCSDLSNPKFSLDGLNFSLYFSLAPTRPFSLLDLQILFHKLKIFIPEGWKKSNVFILPDKSRMKAEVTLSATTQQFKNYLRDVQFARETEQMYREISSGGFLLSVNSRDSKTFWWFHL